MEHCLTRNDDPTVFVVTDTRLGGEREKEITNILPFDESIHTKTIGYIGGLWVLGTQTWWN